MKVLKKGRKQKGWSKEVTCTGNGNGGGGCGAKLLVEFDDLYRTSHSDYGGDTEHFETFECVECGVETDLSNYSGPEAVTKSKAQFRKEKKEKAEREKDKERDLDGIR